MNKGYKILTAVIVLVLAAIVYFIYSSGKDFNSLSDSSQSAVKIENLSSMMLTLEDFPPEQAWRIRKITSGEIPPTANDDSFLSSGWKRGYQTTYEHGQTEYKSKDDLYSTVSLVVLEYDVKNISRIIQPILPICSVKNSRGNNSCKPIGISGVGDEAKAYEITLVPATSGPSVTLYIIQFRKKNLGATLFMVGPLKDYDLLLNLSKKVSDKIE